MPIVSKYSNERVEKIIQKLIDVIVLEKIPADLALTIPVQHHAARPG